MTDQPCEMLRLYLDHNQLAHAAYPTAIRTLCGIKTTELDWCNHKDFPPGCTSCDDGARSLDRADQTAPAWWYRHPPVVSRAKPRCGCGHRLDDHAHTKGRCGRCGCTEAIA